MEPIRKTAKGLLLPDNLHEKQNVAEVIAVGPGRRTESGGHVPVSFAVGDRILLPESFLSTEVKCDGEDYILLKEDDVLGKFLKE